MSTSISIVRELEEAWEACEEIPDLAKLLAGQQRSKDLEFQILLTDLHFRWRNGAKVSLEDYFRLCPSIASDVSLATELALEALGYWEEQHGEIDVDQFADDVDLKSSKLRQAVLQECQTDTASVEQSLEVPRSFGRYRIEREIGRGSYGHVFLAEDTELLRSVAIKIPSLRHVARVGGVDAFLSEARVMAAVDAHGIVPVYDVGVTENGLCFVVSKYISGGTLADFMSSNKSEEPLDHVKAVRLVIQIARALDYAHRQNIVHRDLKPANILIDADGNPWITDFGLALVERDVNARNEIVGTPAWMSPEQARGEGHRVDARSDIYSLGVILYELLTERRPFQGKNARDVLRQIRSVEPSPARQIDPTIPRELDRVCLKAIARREFDRYSTAADFADDLQWSLAAQESSRQEGKRDRSFEDDSSRRDSSLGPHATAPLIPRGLRSFDAGDQDFFLSLVPGPRTRDGVPDAVDFWVSRLNKRDVANTFSVGVLYGPSGSGKSSLFKAGVLPRLDDDIEIFYIAASRDSTESELLGKLRQRFPEIDGHSLADLPAFLGELRRQGSSKASTKIVLCIDQFEQWLHGWDRDDQVELVRALRQCDGANVQAVLSVRDDFWMGVTQLMRSLGDRLIERENSCGVDLFDTRHAKRVLRKFGQAYGAISVDQIDPQNEMFIDDVIESLSNDGRIVAVQLSLFAEIVKHKPWIPETLSDLGGTLGVGVTFLEETFGNSAPPSQRYHAKTAREILRMLLPESGIEIRDQGKTVGELRSLSDGFMRDSDLDDALRLLDHDLRLITPVDAQMSEVYQDRASERKYQLSHDYLVPALREWLTMDRRRTISGRTELLMNDLASDWQRNRSHRHLPSITQYASMLALVNRNRWSQNAARMMKAAKSYHLTRGFAALTIALVVGFVVFEYVGHSRSNVLTSRLLDARTSEVPLIISESRPWRRWFIPNLMQIEQDPAFSLGDLQRRQLHVDLVLIPNDKQRVERVIEKLGSLEPEALMTVLDVLHSHQDIVVPLVEESVRKSSEPELLSEATALARFDTKSDVWSDISKKTTYALLRSGKLNLGFWAEQLRPVKHHLVKHLRQIALSDRPDDQPLRGTAAAALSLHGADDIDLLYEIAVKGTPLQQAELLPVIAKQADESIKRAHQTWQLLEDPDSISQRISLYQQKANAACIILLLDRDSESAEFLKLRPNPTVRSYLINRIGKLPGATRRLLEILTVSDDDSVVFATTLSLGESCPNEQDASLKSETIEQMQQLYLTHDKASIRSAAQWSLQQCGVSIEDLGDSAPSVEANWHMNALGQTMVAIHPKPMVLGGSPGDAEKHEKEFSREMTVGRSFVIATHEVTQSQFAEFLVDRPYAADSSSSRLETLSVGPAYDTSWYQAARFCNWLSEKEGIEPSEWCYDIDANADHLTPVAIAVNALKRTGYRLPTPAEWEYASRAGVATSRYHGEGTDLLTRYGWHIHNANHVLHPIGSLKPNDFGLFDMFGNASEWSNCRLSTNILVDDCEEGKRVAPHVHMFLLGGMITRPPSELRSSSRRQQQAKRTGLYSGIRLVRTIE